MPRYFFDVHGDCRELDRDGVELADIAAAKIVATSFAACLLRQDPKRFWGGGGWQLRVRGDSGAVLFEIVVTMNVAVAEIDPRLEERVVRRRPDSKMAVSHC